MAITRTHQFFDHGANLVIDVRSLGEFKHAHIPGALNMPLFTDEERALVGTTYKQESKERAIKAGLDFFGRKMREMIEWTETKLREKYSIPAEVEIVPADYTLFVHCWRGGMRSGGVAWLLDLYGFNVLVLEGGYKAFRTWVLNTLEQPGRLLVLAGNTGAGKTSVLSELASRGHAVIDLEAIACHKGSAFGNIGMPEQPGQEMFENMLAVELYKLKDREIWIEDESIRIGHVNLPRSFWDHMGKSHHFTLEIPFDKRLDYTVREYGSLPVERMVNAIIRIKKRLGGLETRNAVNALIDGDVSSSFSILLRYYDKWYHKAIIEKQLPPHLLTTIICDGTNAKINADLILEAWENYNKSHE